MAAAFVAGFLVLLGSALAVPALRPPGAAGPALVAAVLLLHLAAAGAAGTWLWLNARRLRLPAAARWGLTAMAALWLVPPTGAFLGLLAAATVLVAVHEPGERSLGGPAIAGAPAVAALPSWQRLVAGIESRGRREPGRRAARRPVARSPAGEGEVERRFLLLCLGKGVLLFLEAGAAGWALRSAAEAGLPGARGYAAALRALELLTLAAGTAALAAMGVAFAMERARPARWSPLPLHPAAAPAWAGTLLAASAGLSFGAALAGGKPAAAGGVLALFGLGGAVAGTVTMVRVSSPGRQRSGFLASVGFCSAGLLGMTIARDPSGPQLVQALEQLLWLGPLLSAILGAAGLASLRLALGGGSAGTAARGGTRSTLERPWLVAPAVLPLGALAVPLWVLARHRRRWRVGPGEAPAREAS